MPPPDKPTRPPRRFSAIKPPTRRKGAAISDVAAEAADPLAADAAEPIPSPAEPSDEEALARPVPEPLVQPDPGTGPGDCPSPAPKKASDTARIAKVMARAGLCSRRDAEAWIAAGRVAVNGTVLTSPALDIGPGDAVTVDGYPIDKPERTRLFLFNKARGLVTTSKDPEGRPTVFDALPPELPRLVTVGRLDINTEGLLLLTNDGGLARLLELPSTGWIRRYRVRANGTITQPELDALARGITVDGVAYGGIAAKLDRVQGANLWLTMGLKEGKNREIKRVLEHLGLAVTRLIRISFGPFQLGELADNAVEEVRTRVLRDQLGSALAKQAGVDLEGPAGEPVPAARVERMPRDARRAALPSEPRRRTERAATADRRGRPVAVERITTPGAGGERGAVAAPRRSRFTAPDGNARSREMRDGRSGGGGRSFGEARSPGREDRRPASRTGDARPGREAESGRPPRRTAASRDPRDDRPGDRAGRESGTPSRFSERRRETPPFAAESGRPGGRGARDGDAPGRSRAPRAVRDGNGARGSRRPSGAAGRPPRSGHPGGGGRPRPGGGGTRGGPGGGKGRGADRMRIVGGRFRGRALVPPPDRTIRPTGDRLRETIFNVLEHAYGDPCPGARVLDLFAGTGALGLEALSRGAAFALFVDDGVAARACLRDGIATLGVGGVTRVFRRDATRLGAAPGAPFSLAFLDPPYGQDLAGPALAGLHREGWLQPDALCVVEDAAAALPDPPAPFAVLERRVQADTAVLFCRYRPATTPCGGPPPPSAPHSGQEHD